MQQYARGLSASRSRKDSETRVRAVVIFAVLMTLFVVARSFLAPYSIYVYVSVGLGTLCVLIAYVESRFGRQPLLAFAALVGVACVGHMHSVYVGGGLQSPALIWGVLWPATGMMMVGRRFGLAVLLAQFVFYTLLISMTLEGHRQDEFPVNFRANPYALFTSTLVVSTVLSLMLWFDDVREVIALEYEQERAEHDFLTGLPNRAGFERSLEESLDADEPVGLLAIDVDYFKHCNDNLGHEAGDECLQQIAAALATSVRGDSDVVARTGGDEFSALLPNISRDAVHAIASRMHEEVAALQLSSGEPNNSRMTITIGIAHIEAGSVTTPRNARQIADKALYLGKHEGRNCTRSLTDAELTEFHVRA